MLSIRERVGNKMKKQLAPLIILLCLSIILNIFLLYRINQLDNLLHQREAESVERSSPPSETEKDGSQHDTQSEEVTNDQGINRSTVLAISLYCDYNPETESWTGGAYQLRRLDNKCTFGYKGPNDADEIGYDISEDTFNSFLEMICSQDLVEYQAEADEYGKVIYKTEPYNLTLLIAGRSVHYENPENMDAIIARFEKLRAHASE